MSKTLLNQTKKLLSLLPDGYLLRDKYDSDTNMYKFWTAIAMTYVLLQDNIDETIKELTIETTELLIARWEQEFGIPDSVIDIADTIADRRKNILLKKGGLNLLDIEDFRSLATSLGYDVQIDTATTVRFPPYDVPFYPLDEPDAYFLVIIRYDFSVTNIEYMAEFFELLLPINVGLLLINTGV
jgi:uncharacterized protein YmfQ (DUF2313 family)